MGGEGRGWAAERGEKGNQMIDTRCQQPSGMGAAASCRRARAGAVGPAKDEGFFAAPPFLPALWSNGVLPGPFPRTTPVPLLERTDAEHGQAPMLHFPQPHGGAVQLEWIKVQVPRPTV